MPVDIVTVEQWGIAAIDGEDQAVLDPMMHGLSFDTKALAHIGDGEQAARPLFLKKAQQIGMTQFPQRSTLPLERKAEPRGGERIAVETASDKGQGRAEIQVVGDSGQMHAEWALTQLLRWPSRLAPVCLYGTSSLSSLLLRNGTMVLQRVQQPLLIIDGHPRFLRFGQL